MPLTIAPLTKDDIEAAEMHAEVTWAPADPDTLSAALSDFVPGADGLGPKWIYSTIDQWIDASTAQPGVVFGFLAGFDRVPVLLKSDPDGQVYLGTVKADPENPLAGFASLTGSDGDGDEDDPPRPAPGGTGPRTMSVDDIVEDLLSDSDDDMDRLIEGLLEAAVLRSGR